MEVGTIWCYSHQMVPSKFPSDELLDERYPARQLLELIGDKWTVIVIYALADRLQRYSNLQRKIPDISKKMLTQTLRRLESQGLLTRTVYPVVPPKVEYRLTPLGDKIVEPIRLLCEWAKSNRGQLRALRGLAKGVKRSG
jgi:DNA-binding HxlR family transcriptional regulator